MLVIAEGNIALGKPTTERDFHPAGWSAANVVDGVNNGNINAGSCFHTANSNLHFITKHHISKTSDFLLSHNQILAIKWIINIAIYSAP